MVSLKQWTEWGCVHHVTAYRWFREGKLPAAARRVRRRILIDPVPTDQAGVGRAAVVYGRVPSAGHHGDQDRRRRARTWTTGQNLGVTWVVTEVGSSLYGRLGAANRAGRMVKAAIAEAVRG